MMSNRFRNKLLSLSLALTALLAWNSMPHEAMAAEEHHGHRAAHGGVLNVIGKELGHVEIMVQGDRLEAWFVGGGEDTVRAVPIEAKSILLAVSISGKAGKRLVLKPDPLKLAGETVGRCSHFVAQAGWLKEAKEFEARGEVMFKGTRQKLIIQHPNGYGHDCEVH
jgi:hypothetical protein